MMRFVFGKQVRVWKFFMFFGMCLFCKATTAQPIENDIQSMLINIQEIHSVAKMEIIHIPFSLLSIKAITPDELEETYHYKLTIRITDRDFYFKSFKQVLQNTNIEKGNEGDVRWGVILFNEKSRRIASIYVSALGSWGYINSVPVAFSTKESGKNLSEWLNDSFLALFK